MAAPEGVFCYCRANHPISFRCLLFPPDTVAKSTLYARLVPPTEMRGGSPRCIVEGQPDGSVAGVTFMARGYGWAGYDAFTATLNHGTRRRWTIRAMKLT